MIRTPRNSGKCAHQARYAKRAMRRGQLVAYAATAVLASTVAPQALVATAHAADVQTADPSSLADDRTAIESASAEAARSGEPVELLTERTETDTVWVEPSGLLTREISSVPVRVERDGNWIPVNYTLEKQGDQLVPAASDIGLSFSAGGDGLVDLVDGDQAFGLDWPGSLPTPTLDGPTAIYADVLPGVDLLMTAVPGGYSQVLRVDTPEAAKSPALDQLRLPAEVSTGATVVEASGGGFTVRGGDGDVAFEAPAPTMWDSSGRGVNAAGEAAGEGDQIQTMHLSADEDAVVVTPDQRILDDPDTVYPVYIDPDVAGPRNDWAMVQKEYPTTEFYKWDNNDGYGEGVGYQNSSGVSTKRLIWEFDLGPVPNAATIVDATMRVDETHSWSCTKAAVNLDRVGLIGPGTNWNNQPAQVNSGNLATSNIQVRLGNSVGGDCKKDITPIAFSTEALAGSVKNALDENTIALRLSATESDPVGWKRFQNDATLSITYNRPPGTPYSLQLMDVESGRSCGDWVPSRTSLPTLAGRINDPDGDKVDGRFGIDRYESGDGWKNLDYAWVADLASGSLFKKPMPAADAKNSAGTAWVDGHYRFSLTGRDTRGALGDTSESCHFYLDSVDPVVRIRATVDDHTNPVRTPEEEEWLRPGQTLTFELDPTGSIGYDGKVDVDYYKVTSDIPTLNGKTINPATLGEIGILPVTTSDYPGEHWVSVASYDRAGRMSESKLRLFRVAGAVEKARYNFEQGPNQMVATGAGPVLSMSATGATFSVQHPGDDLNGVPAETYLDLDGLSGQVSAASPVVDTAHAFSVSAWVRASGPITSRRVVASQHNSAGQTFSLALEPGCGSACAVFRLTDPVTGASHWVASTAEVRPGRWYVVAGSFDDLSITHRIRVWVGDGNAASAAMTSVDVPNSFSPGASTTSAVGFEQLGGTPTSRWAGSLEDLRFYTDEVSRDDVQIHIEADNPNN